jgi:hypothetical protein
MGTNLVAAVDSSSSLFRLSISKIAAAIATAIHIPEDPGSTLLSGAMEDDDDDNDGGINAPPQFFSPCGEVSSNPCIFDACSFLPSTFVPFTSGTSLATALAREQLTRLSCCS